MKKIIFTAAAVFAFAFTNAQDVKFGLKGGLNLSTWTGDTEGADLKSRVGFNAGGFALIKLSEKVSLQPEVVYSTQGTKIDNFTANVGGTDYTGDINFNLSYINVPVMFKYYVAEKFNLGAGPQVGFLTSAESVTKLNGYSQTDTQDVKDSFETVDFGLNFGAGYDFDAHFSADIRYNAGLSNIAKTEPGDDTKMHNSVLSLSLGYKF
ncbi:MAG TPA: porin family protein [Flavobacterium sp.]|uniref:porin family protein n=1 Tax=Flavobacterium sp. TaxID=239 RepID=UPI002F3FA12E